MIMAAAADVSTAPKLSIRFVGLGQFGSFMENLLVSLGGKSRKQMFQLVTAGLLRKGKSG